MEVMEAKGYKIIGKFFLILFVLSVYSFIYCMQRSYKRSDKDKGKEVYYEEVECPLISKEGQTRSYEGFQKATINQDDDRSINLLQDFNINFKQKKLSDSEEVINGYYYNEVGQSVKEIKDIVENLNPENLLVNIRQDIVKYQARQRQEKIDQIKSQNTILFGTSNWPFVFYKRDIVSGACFALLLAIEIIFCKQLKNLRIDNIFDAITTDSKELLDLLHKVKNDKQGFEKEYNAKGFFSRMFTSRQKQFAKMEKELRDYVAQRHTLIHKNPFLPKLLWVYALEFFGQKVCSAVESNLLTKDPLVKESCFAYEKQADGQLKQSKEFAPFSIVTLLKFFIAPRLALYNESSQFDFKFQKMINTFCGLGIPSWYFSKFTTLILQILSLGLAAKFFDSYYTSIWTEYLVKNQKELLQILERYNHTKFRDGKEKLAFIELEIRNFIMQGHKQSSWLPGSFVRQWFDQKKVADSWTVFAFGIPVTSLLLYKGYQFYKNLN